MVSDKEYEKLIANLQSVLILVLMEYGLWHPAVIVGLNGMLES